MFSYDNLVNAIAEGYSKSISNLNDQKITEEGSQLVHPINNVIYLDNTTAKIEAIINDASTHVGRLFIVKAISEPASGQEHTVTITNGTWDGTNKVATFADINDALHVYFDTLGNGSILLNTGSVTLS